MERGRQGGKSQAFQARPSALPWRGGAVPSPSCSTTFHLGRRKSGAPRRGRGAGRERCVGRQPPDTAGPHSMKRQRPRPRQRGPFARGVQRSARDRGGASSNVPLCVRPHPSSPTPVTWHSGPPVTACTLNFLLRDPVSKHGWSRAEVPGARAALRESGGHRSAPRGRGEPCGEWRMEVGDPEPGTWCSLPALSWGTGVRGAACAGCGSRDVGHAAWGMGVMGAWPGHGTVCGVLGGTLGPLLPAA